MSSTIPAETIALLYATPRTEALRTGALVALPEPLVDEAGFRWPVTVTRAVYDRCVAVTPCAAEMGCDETGRAWDLLWKLRLIALREGGDEAGPLAFELHAVTDVPRCAHRVRLYAFVSDDESGRPGIVVASARETLGEEQGSAADRYLRHFTLELDDKNPPFEQLFAALVAEVRA